MLSGAAFALFWAMVVLAALPSLSVLLVMTRSATSGFRHGLAASVGALAAKGR